MNNRAARLAAGIGGMLRGFSSSGNFGGQTLGVNNDGSNTGQDVYNLAEEIYNKSNGITPQQQNYQLYNPVPVQQQTIFQPMNYTQEPQQTNNGFMRYVNAYRQPIQPPVPQESQLSLDINKGTEKIQNTLEDIAKLLGYLITIVEDSKLNTQNVVYNNVQQIEDTFDDEANVIEKKANAEIRDIISAEEDVEEVKPEQKKRVKQVRGARIPKK